MSTLRGHEDERLVQALQELAEVQLDLERERLRRLEVETLFDDVVEAMSDALVLADVRGRVRRLNEAAAGLFRRDGADLIGARARDLLGPDIPASPWEVFERDPRGQLMPFEATVPARGRKVPVSISCSVVRDPDGKVTGTLYTARDLSQTHRLLHELERAEIRWRLVAQVGDLLAREVDPRDALPTVCARLSDAVRLGVAVILVRDALIEEVFQAGSRIGPAELLSALAARPLRAGTALAGVMREGRTMHAPVLRPDFPLLSSPSRGGIGQSAALVPLVGKGSPVGALLLFSDTPGAVDARAVEVGETVAARLGLAVANSRLRDSLSELERAREAARTRQDMLAGLSHDMKTPLTVIQTSLAALQSGDVALELRHRVYAAMARQAQRLRSLVQQFLDYSRLEAGHPLTVHLRPTDVGEVAERVVGTWRPTSPIEVEVPPDLPMALADPERLEQVLANLLSNAIKFSPPNTPVSISAGSNGSSVEVRVIDRGRGISPADLANLFDKFHRGRGARGTEGTGLGLYMSRALVEAQGGRLAVTSRLGEGSTFSVVLPAAEERGAPVPGVTERPGPS